MRVKSREYAGDRVLLNRLAMNILTRLQPEHSKKGGKIPMRRLMLRLRGAPEPAINGIIRYCRTAGQDAGVGCQTRSGRAVVLRA